MRGDGCFTVTCQDAVAFAMRSLKRAVAIPATTGAVLSSTMLRALLLIGVAGVGGGSADVWAVERWC